MSTVNHIINKNNVLSYRINQKIQITIKTVPYQYFQKPGEQHLVIHKNSSELPGCIGMNIGSLIVNVVSFFFFAHAPDKSAGMFYLASLLGLF